MTRFDDRLEWASKNTADHDKARSLFDHNANDILSENNAEREEQGLHPHIKEIYTVNNVPPYDPAEENITSSARSNFWAKSGDGRIVDERKSSRQEMIKASKEYENRPDIESRESILERTGALAVR